MAEKRKVVLTKLASDHIHTIHTTLIQEGYTSEAHELMDDFLDTVFGEIPRFPTQFAVCEGVKSSSTDYRMATLYEEFRVIFQIFKEKVLILMILHQSELPF